jgi:Zn-dependent protease/CBS domain-containing protein
MKAFLEFFKRQLLVTHIYGIPVRVDYRWFIVLILMAWLTAGNIPDSLIKNEIAKYALGLITILIFFFSIFLHELAHAFVARREGVDVLEILLHPFGGFAKLRREPDTPRAEFRIAIAGPGASFLIAVIFLLLMTLSNSLETNILTPLFFVLFLLNLLLAIFNLFPGYPLDGGRVLRAFLWQRGKDLNEATSLTGKFGQIISLALIIFGLYMILVNADLFTGFWTILVGVFLFDAAAGIIRQVNSFENLLVENIMELPISIEPGTSVMEFVDNVLPLHRQTVFPVAKDHQLYGFVLLRDIKKRLPRKDWRKAIIQNVMRKVEADCFVETDTSVVVAKELMRVNGIGVLGVLNKKGEFVGFIQRGRIRRRN